VRPEQEPKFIALEFQQNQFVLDRDTIGYPIVSTYPRKIDKGISPRYISLRRFDNAKPSVRGGQKATGLDQDSRVAEG
jgi:hypothetical protein